MIDHGFAPESARLDAAAVLIVLLVALLAGSGLGALSCLTFAWLAL